MRHRNFTICRRFRRDRAEIETPTDMGLLPGQSCGVAGRGGHGLHAQHSAARVHEKRSYATVALVPEPPRRPAAPLREQRGGHAANSYGWIAAYPSGLRHTSTGRGEGIIAALWYVSLISN